jgi:xylose isomerase
MSFVDLRYQVQRRSPEELLQHLRAFELDLKMSVGIWYFAPGGGRFHAAYTEPKGVEERLEMAYELARYGIQGLEAHYPSEVNGENLHLYKRLEKETGIRLVNIGPYGFHYRESEFGTLSNPYPEIREKARQEVVQALKIVKEADANGCGIWPGIDGYTNPYGHMYYEMWDRFEESLASAMDEVPGVRVAIETKPYEPIPNNIYRTSADGLILAHDVEKRLKHPENQKLLAGGHALVAMQPEIGHIRMGYEDAPYVFSRYAREGRLLNTHWNSQPLGNYDQDLNLGAVEWEQAEAALYVLKMIGYQGYFTFDINPERMPLEKAIQINTTALRVMNERINALPHERILAYYFDPANQRGELEMTLIESMRKAR